MAASFVIESLNGDSPALQSLLRKSTDYMSALYPAASNHLEDVEALLPPAGFLVGVYESGAMIGCGAVKLAAAAECDIDIDTDADADSAVAGGDDSSYGEIKRVFVLEEHRGRGISTAIMQTLEARLVAHGIRVARLETGIRQPQAIGLYRRLGYAERPPFGSYQPDPLSIFMEKRLR